MRIAPTRRVAARALAGDGPLPGDQARGELHLHIGDGRLLRLGEAADIVVGVADVVLELLRDPGGGGVDLVAGEHDIAVVAVELGGIVPCGGVPADLDGVEDGLNGLPHIARIVGGDPLGLLQIGDRHGVLLDVLLAPRLQGWRGGSRGIPSCGALLMVGVAAPMASLLVGWRRTF